MANKKHVVTCRYTLSKYVFYPIMRFLSMYVYVLRTLAIRTKSLSEVILQATNEQAPFSHNIETQLLQPLFKCLTTVLRAWRPQIEPKTIPSSMLHLQ